MKKMICVSGLTERLPDIFHDEWVRKIVYYISARQDLLIGIVAVLFLLSVLGTKKQNRILLILYGAGIVYVTLLSRASGTRRVSMTPFWSYRLLPGSLYFQRQVMNNILLFVPVGTFLYNLRPKSSTFYFPFLVSLGVEVLQFLTGRGLFEIDDLISNTLGGLIGCVMVLVWMSARKKICSIKEQA